MDIPIVKIKGKTCIYYGKYHISQVKQVKIPKYLFFTHFNTKKDHVYIFLEPKTENIEMLITEILRECQARYRIDEYQEAANYILCNIPDMLKDYITTSTGTVSTSKYCGKVIVIRLVLPNTVYYIDPLAGKYTDSLGLYRKLPKYYSIAE